MGYGLRSSPGGGAVFRQRSLVESGFARERLERIIEGKGHLVVASAGVFPERKIQEKGPAAHVPVQDVIVLGQLAGFGIEILAGAKGPVFIQAQAGSTIVNIGSIGRARAWVGEVIILSGGQVPTMVLWVEVDAVVEGTPQGVVYVISQVGGQANPFPRLDLGIGEEFSESGLVAVWVHTPIGVDIPIHNIDH